MRFIRALGFSVLYFLLFTGYFLFLTIQTLAAVQPHELIWYLQHPLESLASMIIKWGRNPLMVMTFLRTMFGSLVLGLMTDWGYESLRKRIENTRKIFLFPLFLIFQMTYWILFTEICRALEVAS